MMADLREPLDALLPGNRGPLISHIGENPSPYGANLTNLLLIELLEKQSEQFQKDRNQGR